MLPGHVLALASGGIVRALTSADADKLHLFVRSSAPLATRAAALTYDVDPSVHAQRLVTHWRREAAVLTGLTGLGGRLAFVAQEAVSSVVQSSLVVSLCEATGVSDPRERTRLLALAVLDGAIPFDWVPSLKDEDVPPVAVSEPDSVRDHLLLLGQHLLSLRRVVMNRRSGKLWHRGLSFVPVVGAAGVLLGERHALELLADRALLELRAAGHLKV